MARKRKIELYEETKEDIKRVARQLMAERGTNGLSMRAIARELEMTAPALYHYFAKQDDLITALIVDAFRALGDAVEASMQATAGQAPSKRLLAGAFAYRQWAFDYPIDFQLIYGNPIPGFSAPAEITVPASAYSLAGLTRLVHEALISDEWTLHPPYDEIPPSVETGIRHVLEQGGFPADLLQALYLGSILWVQLHGMITLEMFGHLPPVVGDMDTFFQQQTFNLLRTMGLTIE